MAERRAFRSADVEPAAAVRPAGSSVWFVEDAADLVRQPFYVALGRDGSVCWTDDLSRALPFASKQAADRFALDRMTVAIRVRRRP